MGLLLFKKDFEDHQAANEAIMDMKDGKINGKRVIVEIAGTRKNGRKSVGPNSEDKCYNCDRPGHWATECRKERR